jgi:ABC-type antimicrobial peptide transport system ATPase subunit
LEKAYESDIATPNRPLIQSLGAILDDDDDVPDFSQFLEWASRLTALDGGSNTIVKLVS